MSRHTPAVAVAVAAVLAVLVQVVQASLPGSEAWPLLNAALGTVFILLVAFVAVAGVALARGGLARRRDATAEVLVGVGLMVLSALSGAVYYVAPAWFPPNAPLAEILESLGTLLGFAGAFLVALSLMGRLARPDDSQRVSSEPTPSPD